MLLALSSQNQLKKILPPQNFARIGLRADYIKDAVYLSRKDRSLGHIKKSVGKFTWYAAHTGEPRLSAFSPHDLLSGIARQI